MYELFVLRIPDSIYNCVWIISIRLEYLKLCINVCRLFVFNKILDSVQINDS